MMTRQEQQDLYETDYYGWIEQQLRLLRSGQLQAADIGNLAEEIEDMSRKIQRELESRLKVLMMHLLKWQYQPDCRGASWEITIKTQRRAILSLLSDKDLSRNNFVILPGFVKKPLPAPRSPQKHRRLRLFRGAGGG